MNPLVENSAAQRLCAGGFMRDPAGDLIPPRFDASGRPVPSAQNFWTIQARALDIRPFSHHTDSAGITAPNVGIRALSGERDAVTLAQRRSAIASASSPVGLLLPVYFLPTDVSAMRQNVFVVVNRALLSLSVRITLQIAPVDSDNYYVNDGSSYDLIGGSTQPFVPSKLMRFARIRVSALISTATVEVYYFGRT